MKINRRPFYLSRGQSQTVLGTSLTFYPGSPTIPTSFIGNTLLQAGGSGVGAELLNGITSQEAPFVCENLPEILSVGPPSSFTTGDGIVVVPIVYEEILPGDTYQIFLSGSGVTIPILSSTITGPNSIDLMVNITDSLLGGLYTLKIIRSAENGACFTVRPGSIAVVEVPCLLVAIAMSGSGVPPMVPIVPGTLGNMVTVLGAGFLSGPLTVTITQLFGAPPGLPLPVTLVTVINDNTLSVTFDTLVSSDGLYEVRIALTADPTCFATRIGINVAPA